MNEVLNWPPILLGVIGSGLFWLILKILTRFFGVVTVAYSGVSAKAKHARLLQEYIYLKFRESSDYQRMTPGYFLCINEAIHYVVVSAIWVTAGLIFINTNQVIFIIGAVGGVLNLFSALSWVAPMGRFAMSEEKREARVKELRQKLNEYKQG
jgi:uncharacterized membrane protein YccF (DUF307 family)